MTFEAHGNKTIILRSLLSKEHPCEGEEVILRLIAKDRAVVLYADRCSLAPSARCDGIPSLSPGDCLSLPDGWFALETFQLGPLRIGRGTAAKEGRALR